MNDKYFLEDHLTFDVLSSSPTARSSSMQKFRGSKTRLMTLQIKTPLPPQISFSHQRNSLRIKQFQLFFFSRSCWCCYCLNEVDLLSFSSRADTQRQAISRQLANFAHKHSRAKPRKLYKYTRNVQTLGISETQKWLWMSTSPFKSELCREFKHTLKVSAKKTFWRPTFPLQNFLFFFLTDGSKVYGRRNEHDDIGERSKTLSRS